MSDVLFLNTEEVIAIHERQINLFGGLHGIRDLGLLESAISGTQASFSGIYLYTDTFDMAAAYAFGIIKNHPFLDGNKRTGITACVTFLDFNQVEIHFAKDKLFELAIAIAISKITKKEIAILLRKHSIKH